MKKILFLGLGHLGSIFVHQNNLHHITGTKRSCDLLLPCPVIPYSLGEKWTGPNDFDVVIISFPPSENYAQMIQNLLENFRANTRIVFISSTSVYADGLISEKSERLGQTKNARELIACEDLLRSRGNYLLVRPSGLIDEKRHPKNFFRRVNSVKSSKSNVNLVHTHDVASFLHFAINHNLFDEDYNLACDDHPTKEEFYGYFRNDLIFDPKDSKLRIIDNTKSKSTGFEYHFQHLKWTFNT